MSSLTCRDMGLGNFSDKDSLRHTPNREHCPWLPCRSHVPNWKLLCLWCIEGQRSGRASLSRRKSLRNFPGSCQQSRCSRLLWHYIYQKSKWVNCSLRNSLVDESQTVIKLFGCCAWSCHAYRHVRTLTRRCGVHSGLPLRDTEGKGIRAKGVDAAPCRSWSGRVSVPKEGAKHSYRQGGHTDHT